MDFTAPRRALLRIFDTVLPAVDSGSAMPLLHTIQLTASARGVVSAVGSDLVVACVARLQAPVKKPGSACVPAKLFRDVVSRMKEGDVTVTLKGSSCSIKGTGSRAATSIPTMPGEDFPSIPTITDPAATVPAAMLSALLKITRPSVSLDQSRPHLACAMLEMTGSHIRAVSTDGHRLSKVERAYEGSKRGPWLIPSAFLSRVKIPDEGDLQVSGGPKGPVMIEWGAEDARVTWTTKVVDAAYPSYEQVIPQSWDMTVSCVREELLESLRAVMLIASDRTNGVQITAKGETLSLCSDNPERGKMTDDLPCEMAKGNDGNRNEIVIGVNADYLAAALSSLPGERVTLCMVQELDPIRLECPDESGYVGVIMPMRV